MACACCGSASCDGSPCTYAPRKTAFTVQTAQMFARSLARKLVKPVDRIRDLNTRFGLRPYLVFTIFTQWSGGQRNSGEEVVVGEPTAILPTPKISDLDELAEIVSPVGLDEQQGIVVSEISGCYTEEQLRGFDNATGAEIPPDRSFYWEVEFLRADGASTERRRFNISAAPNYKPDNCEWIVRLTRSRPERTRSGATK